MQIHLRPYEKYGHSCADIRKTLILKNIIRRALIPNFTQIVREMWKERIENPVHTQVKYGFQ